MADDTLAPEDVSSAIRENVRSTVTSNGGMSLKNLKGLFPSGDVPHITMGQVRKLIEDRLSVLQKEVNDLHVQLQQARDEAAEAAAARAAAEANREKDALRDRIAELEEQIRMLKGDESHEIALRDNEIAKLKGLLEGVDMAHEERIRRIADLEEQLKEARDALAEANKEIRRLLSELRYAEPIVMPDHDGFAAVMAEVKAGIAKAPADAQKALGDTVRYAGIQEEMCRAELPKLIERMNNLDASFPAVARMLRLATLHHEQRRWLGALNKTLGGTKD